MTHRRPLGPGVDRDHQDVADPVAHRPGRTAAERAADVAPPPPQADLPNQAPTGRRTLAVREP
ncbi:hypothetical protein ACFVVL_34760 [Kitasatospora sp. NPDC058115]|uniref:hypothetical protein n=1 Tax=Kitasatospora sp. NPDC058115 TaxID=3346347 RepID=UPI0036DB1B79